MALGIQFPFTRARLGLLRETTGILGERRFDEDDPMK
jgi:hypothetical protein